jgi:hypothetical protein
VAVTRRSGSAKTCAFDAANNKKAAPTDNLVLSGPPLQAGRDYHIGFGYRMGSGFGKASFGCSLTTNRWIKSINGKSIAAVNSRHRLGEPMLYIGSSKSAAMPFRGRIYRPPS